jgi:hypothetical protein
MAEERYGSDEWIYMARLSTPDKVVLRHLFERREVTLSREEYERAWKTYWMKKEEADNDNLGNVAGHPGNPW